MRGRAWKTPESDGPVEPELEARLLMGLGFCRRLSAEFEAAAADSRRVLGLIRAEVLWDRADALLNLLALRIHARPLRRV